MEKSLQKIGDEYNGAGLCSQHANYVRRPEIAGAVLAEVDAAQSSGDVRGRYRAGQIGNDQADDRTHLCGLPAHDDPQRIPAKSPRLAELVV